MIHNIDIDTVFTLVDIPIADVRTPAEFEHGHMPGAHSLPLFTNAERVEVGTTYKQQGREQAILLGFDLTGSKWSGFIRQALIIAPDKKIIVHCWRGGMRSGAMAWALNLYGFEVYLIQGGYKSYRNWVINKFEQQYPLVVLSGKTGSGKTGLLKQLKQLGEQVIDLEGLAKHQGSAYGSMGYLTQPTQEQFENDLACHLHNILITKILWIEDESITIGKIYVPKPLHALMQQSWVINASIPDDERVTSLVAEYGSLDPDFLIDSTTRIHKRLGPDQTRDAIQAITEGRMADFIRIVLKYYDKAYAKGLQLRNPVMVKHVAFEAADPANRAEQLIALSRQLKTT